MMLVMKRKKGISRKNHQNQQKSQQIRKYGKNGINRKASVDFGIMDVGGIKGQRTRQLLNELVNDSIFKIQ
jgi:hypothetical protein